MPSSIENKLLIALTVAMLWRTSNCQAQVLPGVQKQFAASQESSLHEKLFIHTNKNLLLTGEILWFKVYCAEGGTNKPLDVSKVAYIELIDSNHTAVMQTKIRLNKGIGNGSLYLPFSLGSGNYTIRGYTRWMRNFDADFFFEGPLTIVNLLKDQPAAVKQAAPGYDVQFFPEGGQLVAGLSSKVAFKISGSDGKGVACTGAILNQQNDTAARFSTLQFGIGSFAFKPSANQQYKATIKINDQIITKQLPEINASGYVMRATESGENWELDLYSTDRSSQLSLYAIVHTRHQISLAEKMEWINGEAHLAISKSKLVEGVNFITVFDGQQRPLCERIIFKKPARKLMISAQTDKPLYKAREKVTALISTADGDKKAAAGELSLSVFKIDSLQNNDADHIASYLWLRADLKGYIESADYYLDDTSEMAGQALDNLMLSQGWRQFDWDKITKSAPRFSFLPEYTGMILAGHLSRSRGNLPAGGVNAYLTVRGKQDQLYVSKSDSAGALMFYTHDIYGLQEIYVQTNPLRDTSLLLEIANPFDLRHSARPTPAMMPVEHLNQFLADNNVSMQVTNIFRANQIKQFYDPHSDSSSFYGQPNKIYYLDDYTRFQTMEEVLREYVGSIAVTKRQGKFGIKIYDVDKLLGQPQLLLDGVPLFDQDQLFKIDPLKIKKLEMITKNYIYGTEYFTGIMNFFSINNDRANSEINPHALVLDYEGLQLERKFYSPVYDSSEQINQPIPDFRTSLYWNPNVKTPATGGKTSLTFYTGDKAGRFLGIIEGVATGGEAGSQSFQFQVKK